MNDLDFLKGHPLFKGISEKHFENILSLFQKIECKAHDVIIKENDISDIIYLIKEGEVDVVKIDPLTNKTHKLTTLYVGEILGEVSLLDDAPRSATVIANSPSVLLGMSAHKLQELSEKEEGYFVNKFMRFLGKKTSDNPIFSIVLKNLAKLLGNKFRSTNLFMIEALKKELILTKMHIAMGRLIINIVALLCFYLWVSQASLQFRQSLSNTIYFSIPLIGIFSIGVIVMMMRSGYPLSLYGFTLKNWKKSMIEASFATVVMAFFVVIIKWGLIQWVPGYANKPLFLISETIKDPNFSLGPFLLFMMAYSVFAPLQEVIVRGALQSSFYEFLVGKHKGFWSVILSNLLFSVTHTHLSLIASLIVMIPGLIWGWLYLRTRTLIGVTYSHILIGIWSLFIVGLF